MDSKYWTNKGDERGFLLGAYCIEFSYCILEFRKDLSKVSSVTVVNLGTVRHPPQNRLKFRRHVQRVLVLFQILPK